MSLASENVFVRGAAPLNDAQFARKTLDITYSVWTTAARELRPVEYGEWKATVGREALAEATAVNEFNRQLAAYRTATARLSQYRLADGRAEIREMVETGAVDPETGEPVMTEVVTIAAVDPLPATVEQVDDETGETVTVQNPLIIADDAERAAAQAVVDATPAEVIDFVEAQ